MRARFTPFLLGAGLSIVAAVSARAGSFVVTTLDQSATSTSVATGVNANNTVVGYDYGAPSGGAEGFYWTNGSYVAVANGGFDMRFEAVNATGLIAVQTANGAGLTLPSTYNLRSGVFTPIPLTAGLSAAVSGINAAGAMVGYVYESGSSFVPCGLLATGHTPLYLKMPGAKLSTIPSAVNDAGTVVGSYQHSTAGTLAFTYAAGAYSAFKVPGAVVTEPLGISPTGTLFGWYSDSRGAIHGFVRTGSTYSTIDHPDGGFTILVAMAGAGQLFGTYLDRSYAQHAFVYYDGVFSSADVAGAQQTSITAANSGGSFVGYWRDANYINHAFLARCPAASSPCTVMPAVK